MPRLIWFFHLPVQKPRTDEAFYVPLEKLKMKPERDLYIGFIDHNDDPGMPTALLPPGATSRSMPLEPNAPPRTSNAEG